MSEHGFEIELIETARGWVEPRPGPCPLGHPPQRVQNGWQPCRIHRPGGHRTVRCDHPDHPDEESRYTYRPDAGEECFTVVRPSAPG